MTLGSCFACKCYSEKNLIEISQTHPTLKRERSKTFIEKTKEQIEKSAQEAANNRIVTRRNVGRLQKRRSSLTPDELLDPTLKENIRY